MLPMHTDAAGNIVFPASKGQSYRSMLAFSVVICCIFLFIGIYYIIVGDGATVFIVGLVTFVCPIYLILALGRIKYIFEKDGIRLPGTAFGWGFKLLEFVPYSSVTGFYKTRAVSAASYNVRYRHLIFIILFNNGNGQKGSVSLSPVDMDRFESELTKRTGIPVSTDPRAISEKK